MILKQILYGILFFLIIYFLLWIRLYYSLDYIDKITINILFNDYWNGKNVMHCDLKSNLNDMDRLSLSFIKKISEYTLLPFGGQQYYDKSLKGILINGIYFNKLKLKNDHYCNKLYWYHIGKKYDINTPDVHIYIDDTGKKYNLKAINPNKEYIAKPVSGTLGMGMKFMKGNEVSQFNTSKYIIQELMTDCRIPKGDSRCFRYVTLYNGRKFLLIERIKKNSKVSQYPEIKNICHYGYCNTLTKEENKQTYLRPIVLLWFSLEWVICSKHTIYSRLLTPIIF